jgi:heme/copper-type cytochrome/quinol oxidase subunit 2
MRKVRFASIGALIATLGYYAGTALDAAAMPAPPEPALDPGSAAAVSAHSATAHHHASVWTYVLVAVLAIVVTLAVVYVVSRFRTTASTKTPTASGRVTRLSSSTG